MGGGGGTRVATRCRSATIAVRRPRVTAPAAARVGRLVPSPCVASCTSTCCAAGSWWVATHAASSWVSTLRNLKRWRAPTPDGGTTAPHGDMAAQAVSFSLVRGLDPGATQSPGVPSCAATKRPPSSPRHATRRRPPPPRGPERGEAALAQPQDKAGDMDCVLAARCRSVTCSVLTKHHEKSSLRTRNERSI